MIATIAAQMETSVNVAILPTALLLILHSYGFGSLMTRQAAVLKSFNASSCKSLSVCWKINEENVILYK